MQGESQPVATREKSFFGKRSHLWSGCLAFVFLLALGMRLYHIDKPPLEFSPPRQFRSALIARAYYFETAQGIPAWRKNVVTDAVKRHWTLEPSILELLASLGYRVLRRECLWFPRVLSSIFWLVGGVFVYLIARRTASTDAAVISTAFYLLLPFAVLASRSFQPDALMVMMLVVAVWSISTYHERPTNPGLLAAAVVSALAVLTKPVCIFPILGSFVSIAIWRQGLRKAIVRPSLALFVVVMVLPSFAYYGYGLFVAGYLGASSRMSFIPVLLLRPFFWGRWLEQILTVVGPAAFLGGLIGVQLARRGLPRALLVGLWAGYFVFGLVFNYHIHTHDYYQLPLIPIVALSVGPVCADIVNRLRPPNREWRWRLVTGGILVIAIACSLVSVYKQVWEKVPGFERQLRVAKEIGELVGHSTNTIQLNSRYAKPVQYYGEFSGTLWPNVGNLKLMRYQGIRLMTPRKRLELVRTAYSPDYFIISDLDALGKLPDLRDFLLGEFPVTAQTADYLIFDLRRGPHTDKTTPEAGLFERNRDKVPAQTTTTVKRSSAELRTQLCIAARSAHIDSQ